VFDCCDRSGGITPPSLADFRGDLIHKAFQLFHWRECIVKVNLRRSDEDSLDEAGILCLNLWFKALQRLL
jgi:hypothetical protein